MTDDVWGRNLSAIRLAVFDFDGVFSDNSVYVFEDGREAVRCTRADGIGLDKLRARGIELAVISTEVNPIVLARARKLKLRCESGVADKRKAIEALASEFKVPLAQTAFLGNDINDWPALEIVGFPAVVADAHPDVRDRVARRTQKPGGHGAVREFCDRVASAWDEANGR
jgi:YrbI family 3-deoxy-D-manno-octulosonate 8-phosphate phosphatase